MWIGGVEEVRVGYDPWDFYDYYHYAGLAAANSNMPSVRGGWGYSTNNQYFDAFDSMPVTVHDTYSSCVAQLRRRRLVFPDSSSHILYLRNPGLYTWPVDVNGFHGFGDECAEEYLGWWPMFKPKEYTWYTMDGTYLYADTTGHYFPDGRRVSMVQSNKYREYDANGNYIEHTSNGVINASGEEIVVNTGVVETYNGIKWRRDTVTIPGPNGDMVYSIDWEEITVGGNGAPLINSAHPLFNSHPSPPVIYPVFFPYPEFWAKFWVIRYIQLSLIPSANHVSLQNIALGVEEPPVHNSYEFRHEGGEYRGNAEGIKES
jgi:hypothetical protein